LGRRDFYSILIRGGAEDNLIRSQAGNGGNEKLMGSVKGGGKKEAQGGEDI